MMTIGRVANLPNCEGLSHGIAREDWPKVAGLGKTNLHFGGIFMCHRRAQKQR